MSENTVIGDMRDYSVQSKPCLTCLFESQQPLKLSANSEVFNKAVNDAMNKG